MKNKDNSLILTIKEIKDLAEFAGLIIGNEGKSDLDDDDAEITIEDCPAAGLEDEDGKFTHSRKIAYFTGYPEEGAFNLGETK